MSSAAEEFLLTAPGAALLAEAAELSGPLLSQVERLRRHVGVTAEQVHAVLAMRDLRRRAVPKFRLAGQMFFTAAGLERSTSDRVAAAKARRFAGLGRVGDFCCGVGGDLLGIAASTEVRGVDCDGSSLRWAAANAAVCGLTERCEFSLADLCEPTALAAAVAGLSAVHIDPDWRDETGRRHLNPERFAPPRAVLEAIRARVGGLAIKLPTGADFDRLGWPEAEVELISDAGEAKQAVLWFGTLRSAARRATLLPSGRTLSADSAGDPAPLRSVGRFLYEPDSAVIRAGLIDVLCAELGLAVLDRRIAYLTADAEVRDPAVAGFAVRDVLDWGPRRVRDYLRQRGLGRLEIKKRGLDVDPDQLARDYRSCGEGSAVLLLTRIGERRLAIVADRLRPLRPLVEEGTP